MTSAPVVQRTKVGGFKKVLEPMTSPGRTRSEATESDCHRVVLSHGARDVSPGVSLRSSRGQGMTSAPIVQGTKVGGVMKVLEPMTSPGRTRSEATESDCHRVGLSHGAKSRCQPRCLTAFVPGPRDDIGSSGSGHQSGRCYEGVGADDIPRSDEERSDGVRLSSRGFVAWSKIAMSAPVSQGNGPQTMPEASSSGH